MGERLKRTYPIGEPFLFDVFRVPYILRKVSGPLVNVHKFDKLGVQMRIAERSIGHQRVIEMLRIIGVVLQRVKLGKLRLEKIQIQSSLFTFIECSGDVLRFPGHTSRLAQGVYPNHRRRVLAGVLEASVSS